MIEFFKLARTDDGFTLTELLVVIIIIGILAGISIVSFTGSRKDTLVSACKTNYQSTLLGIQAYQGDHDGTLPNSLEDLAPTYVNSSLINTDDFALALQSLPGVSDSYDILVATTSGAVVRTATYQGLNPGGTGYTYLVTDTSGITNGMQVLGSGIASFFSANATTVNDPANAANDGLVLQLENADGILGGWSVSTSVNSSVVDLVTATTDLVKLTTALPTLSSSGVLFGSIPTVSEDPVAGIVTISASSINPAVTAPVLNQKYSLIFGGILSPGTAPNACLTL